MNEDAQKKYRVAHGVWTSKSRIASDMERAAATFKAGDEAWKVRTAAARKEAKEAKEAIETAYAVQEALAALDALEKRLIVAPTEASAEPTR